MYVPVLASVCYKPGDELGGYWLSFLLATCSIIMFNSYCLNWVRVCMMKIPVSKRESMFCLEVNSLSDRYSVGTF